jgi:hypothetical protein
MTGVDIIDEPPTLILTLQGPNPPLGIADLHARLNAGHDEELGIDYTWTQKISAGWPLRMIPATEIIDYERKQHTRLTTQPWQWYGTQYSAEVAGGPLKGQEILLRFDPTGQFKLEASCASVSGSYFFNGQSMRMDFPTELPASCVGDDILQLLLKDLRIVKQAYMDERFLVLKLFAGEGTLYFEPAQ